MTDSAPADPADPIRADIVLPCLDEAEALPRVLARVPDGWRAIVVDNGSTDGSAAIARSLGATVVHEPRRGFGSACHAGLLAAEAEYVCFCDCDGSLDPALLPGFVRRIAEGRAIFSSAGAAPRPAVPGRCTPDWATWRCPACSVVAPASGCTTWGRCGPYAGRRCWHST